MNKIYVVMNAHWIDYYSYSGDPEEIDIEPIAFINAGDAINHAINKAYEHVEEWRAKDPLNDDEIPEAYYGNIFQIVAHRDDHEYIRYWVEELEVQ